MLWVLYFKFDGYELKLPQRLHVSNYCPANDVSYVICVTSLWTMTMHTSTCLPRKVRSWDTTVDIVSTRLRARKREEIWFDPRQEE